MKTLKKQTISTLLAFFSICLMFNCSDDDSNSDSTTLKIKARASFNQNRDLNRTVNATVDISEFKINISEIELEFDDDYEDIDDDTDYDDDGIVNYDDEIELLGPFELDILNNTSNIISIDIPQGNYEELEFEFEENENPNSSLFNKTILVTGTIDDVPFEFWHDFEDELEIDYDNSTQDISIENGVNAIIINFDLNNLFDATTGADLSLATDNDGDGLIEINPNDNDGNTDLANAIKEAVKDVIDLLDD